MVPRNYQGMGVLLPKQMRVKLSLLIFCILLTPCPMAMAHPTDNGTQGQRRGAHSCPRQDGGDTRYDEGCIRGSVEQLVVKLLLTITLLINLANLENYFGDIFREFFGLEDGSVELFGEPVPVACVCVLDGKCYQALLGEQGRGIMAATRDTQRVQYIRILSAHTD